MCHFCRNHYAMDQTHRFNKTRAALAITAILACMPVSFADEYSAYSDTASRVTARIYEKMNSAMETAEKGRELYKAQQYEEALEAFSAAYNELPNSPLLSDRRAYLTELVTTGSVAVAKVYRSNGRYQDAEDKLKYALELDPNNRAAKQEMEYLKDPIRTNPALTQRHVENVKNVKRLLEKAYGSYNLGLYNEARAEFENVLRIDPYNIAARRGMEAVDREISKYLDAARDQARGAMLAAVSAAWEIPVPMDAPSEGRLNDPVANQSPSVAIQMKLKNIILPEVNFEQTSVEEAIDFLRQRARILDTSSGEKGINFIIRNSSSTGAPVATSSSGSDMGFEMEDGGAAMPSAPSAPVAAGSTIIPQLKLTNVPMLEVLKFITENAGMRYKIENYAVVIMPTAGVDDDIYNRNFTVPPTFYSALEQAAGGSADAGSVDLFSGDTSSGPAIKPRESVEALLKKMGIHFPDGASSTFVAASSTLMVRNTQANLDIIEQFIESIYDKSPRQVKITTKFVEVSQDNTEELGFDWVVSPFKISGGDRYLGGGTQGNGSPGRFPGDFVGAPGSANQWAEGITGAGTEPVKNIVTSGLRSGDGAISNNAINGLINNPNRNQQSNSPAPGIMSFTGIFSKGTMQVIMRGLSMKKGTDVLTAPSITAKSGEKAKIEVIREFIYPTDYSEPQLPSSVGSNDNWRGSRIINDLWEGGSGNSSPAQVSSFPVTPSTPTGFQTRPVGVTLDIEPIIGEENSAVIDFKFVPEIVEFDGFINYGSPISTAGIDSEGNPVTVVITENRIEMPVFSTRRVDTALNIYDGHTVAIGGLMQESVQKVEDKVPVLGDLPLVGRLFRSESSNHVKTNLIIFVTGDIIDASGRSVRSVSSPDAGGSMGVDDDMLLPSNG